jgi:endonuclease/exonuclease/phosphatase family metal-dependent hydrolase
VPPGGAPRGGIPSGKGCCDDLPVASSCRTLASFYSIIADLIMAMAFCLSAVAAASSALGASTTPPTATDEGRTSSSSLPPAALFSPGATAMPGAAGEVFEVVSPPSTSPFPWLGPRGIRIASWNMNGFLHSVDSNLERLRLQQGRVMGLTRRYNIVILLETHGGEGSHLSLRGMLPFWGIYMSFHASPSSGGVIMLVHPDLMGQFSAVVPHVFEPGRAVLLDFIHPSFGLRVTAVHCDCRHRPASRRSLWRAIDLWRPSPQHGLFFVIGDLNSIARGDCRFYPATGDFKSSADPMEDIFFEASGRHLVELAQEAYTRRGLEGGHFRVLSRIDRAFCNFDTLSLLDLGVKSGVEWPLASGHDPSDHVPIFVTLQAPPARPPQPSVPVWVARLPAFPATVQLMLDFLPAATSVHHQLSLVKEAFHSAAIELREISARLGATSVAEKLYWSTLALRAFRRGDMAACRWHCSIVPELLLATDAPEEGINLQVIIEMVQAFSLTDLAVQVKEIEDDNDSPPEVKARQTAKLRRLSEAWARTRRRLTLTSLLGPDGTPILDDGEATSALCEAWAPTFSNTSFDSEGAERLLQHAAPPLVLAPTSLDLAEFTDMISRTGNSAAGPDGISYAAWRLAPASCTEALHGSYLDLFAGNPPPPSFNSTNMVFIPKPSGDPLEKLCARPPAALRPISLANTDNKVIAMAFARTLGEVASQWCSGDQFGFIAGRSIWDAVMLFEAAALYLSRRCGNAGLAFIDFRAAFPSILHGWIRMVLLATGLPQSFVAAFMLLYTAVSAAVRFGNCPPAWLPMLSGIRQGCPASGAIFAICIDPLLRRIGAWLPSPWSWLTAYADDLAIALRDARHNLARLFSIIDEAEACTGLRINVAKSSLVPLWTTDIAAATSEVRAMTPRFAELEVASFFKHLGVLVGPGAAPTRWAPAFAKFLDRALCVKAAGGGLSESIRMYGALAVSTLQYIGQYCSPPASVRKIEARAIARITSSPLYAFPVSLGSGLQEIGLRPGFTHIETMAAAAQLRAISSSKHLGTILAFTDVAVDGVDANSFVHDRWADWRRISLTTGVRENLRRLAATPALAAVTPGAGMQQRLYRLLLPSLRALHPITVIRARLSHWGFDNQELALVTWFAELRLRQCAKLKLPSTIFWSMLRLWCNALPTSRRFRNQVAVRVCPLGCGTPGGDDIRHLAECPLLFTALLPIVGGANSWPNIGGLRSLFLLEPRNCTHDVVLGAALADTFVHIYLNFRRTPPPNVEGVRRACSERLCLLMQWSPRVRSAVIAARSGNNLLAPLVG